VLGDESSSSNIYRNVTQRASRRYIVNLYRFKLFSQRVTTNELVTTNVTSQKEQKELDKPNLYY